MHDINHRILILAGHPASLTNFRGSLLAALVAGGHDVHAGAPGLTADTDTVAKLRMMGVTPHDIPFERSGLNPIADLRAMFALVRLMRTIRPDTALGYTIKPVIWGTLAAVLARVPHRYALITGLGYAFTGAAQGKRRLIQILARMLYKLALHRASKVFFQNPDDAALFRDLGLVAPQTPVVVVNGSGVDTDHYAPQHFPKGPTVFLLIARLLGDKGIREYAAAARILRRTHPEVEFHLVGGQDTNPDAIAPQEVAAWQTEGALIWHGAMADVRPAIAASHVYVLPSYREGTPRSVLEAMSMGRPIITTDAPGCRETVVEGVNGFLVPVRNTEALAEAMLRFLENPALFVSMGRRSREIAEDRYDVHKVNAVMLKEMGL